MEKKIQRTKTITQDNDELLGDFGNLGAAKFIKLDQWLLFVEAEMRSIAVTFIEKLIGSALRDYHLDISNPSIIIIPNLSEISTLIKSYIGMQNAIKYKLVMVILPYKSQTFYTQIKDICNKYAVPSQLMLNSTLVKALPLYQLIMSLKEVASMKGYNNSIEILGKDLQAKSKYDIENKIFAGTIKTPHKARYQSEGGTVKIIGWINFENDENKIIEYERISLINWPTFYTNDRVTFRVELSSSGQYFHVFELKVDPLFLSNPPCPITLKRYKGKMVDYRNSTLTGTILGSESQSEITFRNDECLDKLIKDLTIGDLLEYSVIQLGDYPRAIIITKSIT